MKIKGTDAQKAEKIFLNDFTHYLEQLLILKRRKLRTKKMNKKGNGILETNFADVTLSPSTYAKSDSSDN